MTVSSSVCKHVFQGNGVQREWPWSFQLPLSGGLPDTSVIEVYVESKGVLRRLSASEFDVAPAQQMVVFPKHGSSVPVLTAEEKFVLLRVVPERQYVDLENQGHFKAEVIEGGLDNLEFQIQQLREEADRSIKAGVSSSESPQQILDDIFSARDVAQSSAVRAEHIASLAPATFSRFFIDSDDFLKVAFVGETSQVEPDTFSINNDGFAVININV